MKYVAWGGWAISIALLVLMLTKPVLDPVAAYCRGAAELLGAMYGVTSDQAGQAWVADQEQSCYVWVSDDIAAGGKGSKYRGPLLP